MNGHGVYCSADGRQVEGKFVNDNYVSPMWYSKIIYFYILIMPFTYIYQYYYKDFTNIYIIIYHFNLFIFYVYISLM